MRPAEMGGLWTLLERKQMGGLWTLLERGQKQQGDQPGRKEGGTYRATHALAPQSKMLEARLPSMSVRRRSPGGMASSSRRRSGSTDKAAVFSRSLSSLKEALRRQFRGGITDIANVCPTSSPEEVMTNEFSLVRSEKCWGGRLG